MTSRRWRSLKVTKFPFNLPGDTLEGRLTDVGTVTMYERVVFRYEFLGADENRYFVLATTVLERLLKDVKLGAFARITYLGEAKSASGYRVKDFDVEVEVEEAYVAEPTP